MEGAVTTAPDAQVRPRALAASTMCEAFQLTAAERPDQIALRTIGDQVSITFAQYAERVRRIAGGLHALGLRPGDTVGFMLTNRPDVHLLDAAVIHLGAIPFSIYDTSAPEQISYLLGDAANRVMIVEAAFVDRAIPATSHVGTVDHLVVIDGGDRVSAEAITLQDLEAAEPADGTRPRSKRCTRADTLRRMALRLDLRLLLLPPRGE
jgi:long-chain acyl-CoA synthetase